MGRGWAAVSSSVVSQQPQGRGQSRIARGIELLDVKQSYRFEQGFTLELYTTPDSQEARNAFVEKRDAKY